jgi:hypothetical protein
MEELQAVQHLCALHDTLEQDKACREDYWQELHGYTLPAKAAILGEFTMAERPFDGKYDAMGMLGATRFAANMSMHLTPPQSKWFILSPTPGSAAAYDRRYAESLSGRAERLHYAFQQGNFETEIQGCYEDLGAGTCCVGVQKDDHQAFSLSTRPVSEYTFLENDRHQVDTVFLQRMWTAYEAARRFGFEKLPESLQQSLEKMEPNAYTKRKAYLNVCKPNDSWDPAAITADRFPYSSLWIDKEAKTILRKEGVRRLRYVVSRFWRPTGMLWGMGPSDMAYPWIRAKDKAVEIYMRFAAKVMDPPSIWSDDGAFHPKTTAPGTIIKGRMALGDRGMPQYLQLQGNHQIAEWFFNYLDSVIMQCYFADIFRILSEPGDKTAYEVAAVLQKDFSMAVPIVGRQKVELFAPLIRVCLELQTEYELGIHGWMYRGQNLPEDQYDLEIISPLGLAVKYAEIQKMHDVVTLNSALAQVDPRVWDNYSLDEMSRGIGESMGVPRAWLRSITERRAIRERAQQLADQQYRMQQAQIAADTTNKLSQRIEPESPMAMMAAA